MLSQVLAIYDLLDDPTVDGRRVVDRLRAVASDLDLRFEVERVSVPFIDSPISMDQANEREVLPAMEAILSVDTTKGNTVINHRGMAISNTARRGYLLPVPPDLVATCRELGAGGY